MTRPFLLILATLLMLTGLAATAQLPGEDRVKPSLLADTTSIAPEKPFTVAVRLQMQPGWHVYWQFGGDSGAPPTIAWELPAGFKVGPPQWPLPVAHKDDGDLLTYIHEGELAILYEVTPPARLSAGQVTLKASLQWLVCEKICIPGKGDAVLTLPVRNDPQPSHAELFTSFRRALPKTSTPPFRVDWERRADAFTIKISGLSKEAQIEFFPLPAGPELKPEHPEIGSPAADGMRVIKVPVADAGGKPDTAWQGLLVTQTGDGPREGWMLASSGNAVSTESVASATLRPPAEGPLTFAKLLTALGTAFLGGLVLNLMPCVLPVIALKIFGFVRQAGEEPRRIFHLGLAFAAGVFVFFLGLAGLAIGLRAAGHGFFWGMQFADPRLLISLIALVLLFALAMFGTFEITLGGSAENALGTLAQREGYGGAFVHGLFTTLLGTSCTAPFVGTVLGFAVTQPAPAIVAIFLTIATGMCLPYVLLTWRPAWMRFLPKPGAWMERFKQFMGFVLLAVAVWLLGVVGSTRGSNAMSATAWFLVVLALAAWIFGAGRRRWWAVALALAVVIAGGKFFLPDALAKRVEVTKASKPAPNSVGIVWEPFSEERLAEARKAGPVFIDFTAKWCANCKTNEHFVINTEPIAKAFREKGVATLVADWTDFDPLITKWLKSFQRIGVPVYVLYPGPNKEPIVLSELLKQSILLRHLEAIQ